MANYEVNVPKDILPGLLTEKDALPPQRAKLVGGPGLAEVHEDWQEKKYLDMEAFYEGADTKSAEQSQKKSPQDNGPVVLRV